MMSFSADPRKKHKGSELDTNQKLLTEVDKTFYYTADTDDVLYLSPTQQIVYITNNTAFTVVLPSISDAKNITYTIHVYNDSNAVTLTDYPNVSYSDSSSWGGNYTLDAADDYITLRSDGLSWTVVTNGIS